MIDAECFLDDNGDVYLYWGSGLNWINGKCFVVKLKNDMVTFDGSPRDVTPPHYFEAPYMLKRNGMYYLMYSEGKAIDPTYKIRYSTGNNSLRTLDGRNHESDHCNIQRQHDSRTRTSYGVH